MSIESRQFDFLSAMTAVVVLVYMGAAVYALVSGKVNFEMFSAAIGGPAATLLGFWVRGRQ